MNSRNVNKFFKLSVLLMAIISIYVFPGQVKAEGAESGAEISVVTRQEDLWTEPIEIHTSVGEKVTWKVKVPEETDLYTGMGANESEGIVSCGYSIKIPEFGKGTDTFNKKGEEGQVNLAIGINEVVAFQIVKVEEDTLTVSLDDKEYELKIGSEGYADVPFCCWMSSECHGNRLHIYVTESRVVRVNYADLWKSNAITAKKGQDFRLYVDVPEGTTPRGCGGTVKVPGYEGWTDEYDKEQNHIVLGEGSNFIYEFPAFDEAGDIQFTCWMGSGCHYNYIHVTEDGTYNGTAPGAPTDIQVERNGEEATVSFKAPETSEVVTITGYAVTATATDGSGRKKVNGTESPITVTGLDAEKTYTYTIMANSTAGKGTVSEAVQEPEKEQEIEDVRNPGEEENPEQKDSGEGKDTVKVEPEQKESEKVQESEQKDSDGKQVDEKKEPASKAPEQKDSGKIDSHVEDQPEYETVTTKATLDKDGSIIEKDKKTGKEKSSVTISRPTTFTLDRSEYVYDGKEKKPAVTVKAADGKTIGSENYTVTYESNKSVGTAVVKVAFKGNYSGTKKLQFAIAPKGTTISSLKKAKKGFAVKWKKQTTETTGYQIQYSTKKTFASEKKSVIISKKSNKSKKITGLKAKKKYYVRIRTYKKAGGKTYYSSWSKVRTVKTK